MTSFLSNLQGGGVQSSEACSSDAAPCEGVAALGMVACAMAEAVEAAKASEPAKKKKKAAVSKAAKTPGALAAKPGKVTKVIKASKVVKTGKLVVKAVKVAATNHEALKKKKVLVSAKVAKVGMAKAAPLKEKVAAPIVPGAVKKVRLPTYRSMILRSIFDLCPTRYLITRPALAKAIMERYAIPNPTLFKAFLSKTVKAMLDEKQLTIPAAHKGSLHVAAGFRQTVRYRKLMK